MNKENQNVTKGLQGKDLNFSIFMDENYKYISPANNNQIPLIASSPTKNARYLNTNAFEGVIKCGFNVGRFDSHALTVYNMFDTLQTYNQKEGTYFSIIGGADVLKRPVAINEFVPHIMYEKYLGGYDFSDEPEWNKLDEIHKMYLTLNNTNLMKLINFRISIAQWAILLLTCTNPYYIQVIIFSY